MQIYPQRANPLGYSPQSSNMETNGKALGMDAPHGPTTSSLADGGMSLREWATYFGMPSKELKMDPGMAYGRENYDLPEAYRGSSLYLDLIIIYQIKLSQMYAITRLLPLRQWDRSTSVTWDVWKFADGRLDRTPEESMSRLLTSNTSTGRATFFRWGLAFLLEQGFAKTPRGRMNYRMNLIQIANATIFTLCLGAIIALLSCKPLSFMPSQGLQRIEDENDRRVLFQREVDEWGCIHKQESPIVWLWDRLSQTIQKRMGGDTPNILCLPSGSRANNGNPMLNQFFLNGKQADFTREQQTPPGFSTFESIDYRAGDGDIEDPFYQQRKIGQFGYALNHHLNNIKDGEYTTSMMDVAMISERANAFTRIKYHAAIQATGMFHEDPETGVWHLTQYGKVYFSDCLTWGQFMHESGVLDKWCQALANGDKSRSINFIDRFGTTKKPSASIGATKAFAKPGDAFISAKALNLLNQIRLRPTVSVDVEEKDEKDPSGGNSDLAIATTIFLKTIAVEADKWNYRYAACVLVATGSKELRTLLEKFIDGEVIASEAVAQVALLQYSKLSAGQPNTSVSVQPFGSKPVGDGQHMNLNWRESVQIRDTSSAITPEELYGYFSFLVDSPASAPGMKRILVTFYNQFFKTKVEGKLQYPVSQSFDGQTGVQELTTTLNTVMLQPANTITADAFANEMLRLAKAGMYNFLNNKTAASLGVFITPAASASSGHYKAKSAKVTAQLKKADKKLVVPSAADVEAKAYIWAQVPVLSTLLGDANLNVLRNHCCDIPTTGRHTQISELAFTKLLILVENWYENALRKSQNDGESEDKQNRLADVVTFFLQECAWQRIVNLKDVVETDKWSKIFTREVGISQLIEQAKATKFEESLEKTMKEFTEVIDKIDSDFTTEWHKKLPKDVQDALSDPEKLSQMLESKTSDIEMINDVLKSVPKDAIPGKDEADIFNNKIGVPADYFRKLLLARQIIDGEMVRFGLDNNMPPIVGLIYVKKDGTWTMGQAFAMLGDGRVGWTFQGHHDMQIQDDATHKMHVGHWTLYAKPVVIRPDGVAHAFNVRALNYVGGNENTLWELGNEDHRIKYAGGDVYYRSVFAIPVRVNKDMSDVLAFDVTGAFNKYLGTTPEYCTDRMYPVVAEAWGWKRDPTDPLTRPIIPHDADQTKSSQTIVFAASMLLYDHSEKKLALRVRGRGHWGDREYDGCCDARRGAAYYLQPVGAPGTNVTAIII